MQANPRGKIQVRTGSSTRLATPADLASFHITSAEKLDGLVKRVVARELVKLSGVTGSPSDADVVDKAREIVRKSTFELEHKALVDLLQTPDLRKLLPREVARDPEVREQGFSFEVQVPSTSGYRYGDLRSVHIHMDPTGRWTPSVYSSGGRVWPATLDELVRQGITGEQLADAIRVQSLSSLRGRHARQAEAARAALPFPMQLMKMFFPFARR